jgi:FkbM family methyltransferase
MYSLLIAGKFPEPETHLLFSRVIPKIKEKLCFIDVGAAVGEMVIDVAGYDNVAHVVGFEPDPDLAKACRLSAAINEYDNISIIPKVVADEIKSVNFKFNRSRGTSGKISEVKNCTTETVVCTTLDNEIPENNLPYILLIDVEGAEFLVLKGAFNFIKRKQPLIIFEYISWRDNNLPEIMDFLGDNYEIYKLDTDGWLNSKLDNTWNCVAVHKNSSFYPICQSIIVK